MSWGATAFTPIITYNTPPFGFAERTNPSDFNVCPEDPYSGTERLKEDIQHLFNVQNGTLISSPNEEDSNYIEGFSGGNQIFTFYNIVLFVLVVAILYYLTMSTNLKTQ